MKTRIYVGLWIVLTAGCISARADDTPAQAAARAALEQKMQELGNPQTPPPPATPPAPPVQPPASAPKTNPAPAAVLAPPSVPPVPAPSAQPVPVAPVAVQTEPVEHPAAANTNQLPATLVAPETTPPAPTPHPAPMTPVMQMAPAETSPPISNAIPASVATPQTAPSTAATWDNPPPSAAVAPVALKQAGAEPVIVNTTMAPAAKTTWDNPSAAPTVAPSTQTEPAEPAEASPTKAVVTRNAPAPTMLVVPPPVRPATPPTRPKSIIVSATPTGNATAMVLQMPGLSPKESPTNDIVTIYGTRYKNAQVEKVDPDGVIISYSTAGGGWAMCKVYFTDLPENFRQRYQQK